MRSSFLAKEREADLLLWQFFALQMYVSTASSRKEAYVRRRRLQRLVLNRWGMIRRTDRSGTYLPLPSQEG